jgi:hypothetical protein
MQIVDGVLAHDPGCETYRLQETIRNRLKILREWLDQRDGLVCDAVAAGITKQEVHQISGLARTTIDAITKSDA